MARRRSYEGTRFLRYFGPLQINHLVSFKVLFQCKRFAKSVSSSHVRDFRGAMAGRADKGIIITTGTFTAEAKREATRDGVPTDRAHRWRQAA